MEKFYIAFSASCLSSLLGAYITNIFTWEIKDRIDIIDSLIMSGSTIVFVRAVRRNKVDTDNKIDRHKLLSDAIIEFEAKTRMLNSKNSELIKECNKISEISGEYGDVVLDNLLQYLNQERQKTTSFPYMLNQIFHLERLAKIFTKKS